MLYIEWLYIYSLPCYHSRPHRHSYFAPPNPPPSAPFAVRSTWRISLASSRRTVHDEQASRLGDSLALKDERIEELTRQLDRAAAQEMSNTNDLRRSLTRMQADRDQEVARLSQVASPLPLAPTPPPPHTRRHTLFAFCPCHTVHTYPGRFFAYFFVLVQRRWRCQCYLFLGSSCPATTTLWMRSQRLCAISPPPPKTCARYGIATHALFLQRPQMPRTSPCNCSGDYSHAAHPKNPTTTFPLSPPP